VSVFTLPTVAQLAPFAAAGVFDADTLALTDELCTVYGAEQASAEVRLALALALRAPAQGHVCVDLGAVHEQVAVADDAPALPWPQPDAWSAALRACPELVVLADTLTDLPARPLVLDGARLYLARLWADELAVASQLRALAAAQRLQVVTGGPGSGKTTHIARSLLEQLRTQPAIRVALAAPTGKAAARMGEAITEAVTRSQASEAESARMREVWAGTLHRLLGLRPGTLDLLDQGPRLLEHDLVIIDEVSMVSLPLLARLLSQLGPSTQLWLVGDPGQLASVEAGCVLSDIVQSPAAQAGGALAPALLHLTSQYRFGPDSGIGRLAAALREGDADAAVTLLASGADDVRWVDPEAEGGTERVAAVQASLAQYARRVVQAAEAGDAEGAMTAMLALRTLCAHREGPWGVKEWNRVVERALGVRAGDLWYDGRPLMVTRNDHALDLMNGDLGVVVREPAGPRAAFTGRDGALRSIPPVRLSAVDTVHTMTIHKSQGSEFDHVVVVLPPAGSRLLTRELLYTAVTRARTRVTIVGSADALEGGMMRTAARASGLGDRL
jgi:exodeoxyribonuclease V alpha subunit